ncbi:MAG: ferritin-like domain-containing protein [Planctomycetales bacterium]
MEIREFAIRILNSPDLEEKLRTISAPVTDTQRGPAERVSKPARPANLQFALRREAPPMPPFGVFHDPAKRAIAHHIMANHELQALEIMAWTLLAFPDAPTEFRRGMVSVMSDEQRHTRMHAERAAALGLTFGDLPVNDYFWQKAQVFQSELDYLAGLPLVFEGGNLDHTLEFEKVFLDVGDPKGASILRAIHKDEIEHVRFGLHWLRQFKSAGQSDWEAFISHLHWPLRAGKARGKNFHAEPRRAAGMDEDFIHRLAEESPLVQNRPSPPQES